MRNRICILFVAIVASASSARTWRVEKDGSGDFTVIQDALDACAPGDSVLVGPGRFDDFRPGASTVDGFAFQMIAWINTDDITLIGAGEDQTIVGPTTFVSEVLGLPAGSIYVDGGDIARVAGLRIENTLGRVTLRRRTLLAECTLIKDESTSYWSVSLLEGSDTEIRDCEFFGPRGIFTASPAVTRPQIVDCSFQNPNQTNHAIVIGNGASDALISRCTITGYGAGIQTSLGGTATIEDCYLSGILVTALDLDSGYMIVRRSQIDAGIRFPLRVNIGRLEIYDTLIGGGTSATLLTWGDVYMRDCHLLNGGGLTVDFGGPATSTVDLRSNWWGTTDLNQIEQWIDERYPVTLYEPILQGPVSSRPHSFSDFKALFGGQE